MKKTLIISTLAIAVAGLGAVAGQAQDNSSRPAVQKAEWRGHHGWHKHHGRHGDERRDWRKGRRGGDMMRRFQEFDADKDGAVTQAEIDQFRQGQITRFDADKNGTLSLEEYQELWLERMRERMVDAFQSHDDDGNGQVTADEFNERFTGLVERLDRNGDGKLDRNDRRGRRMMHDNAPQQDDDGDDAEPAPQQ